MAQYQYYDPNQGYVQARQQREQAEMRLQNMGRQRQAFADEQYKRAEAERKKLEAEQKKAEWDATRQHHKWASMGMSAMGPWGALVGGIVGTGMEMKAKADYRKKYHGEKANFNPFSGDFWNGRSGYGGAEALKDTHMRMPSMEEATMGASAAGAQYQKYNGGKQKGDNMNAGTLSSGAAQAGSELYNQRQEQNQIDANNRFANSMGANGGQYQPGAADTYMKSTNSQYSPYTASLTTDTLASSMPPPNAAPDAISGGMWADNMWQGNPRKTDPHKGW